MLLRTPVEGPNSVEMASRSTSSKYIFVLTLKPSGSKFTLSISWVDDSPIFVSTCFGKHQVKAHWRFIMGYFASFECCIIPNLKCHTVGRVNHMEFRGNWFPKSKGFQIFNVDIGRKLIIYICFRNKTYMILKNQDTIYIYI